MKRRAKTVLLALAALACAGCPAQGFLASPAEWAAYRATRVGSTFETRLGAAQRYLDDHPEGRFTEEVRASFEPAEEAFWATKKGSKAGVLAYLAVLPRGPHRDQAMRRLGEIETSERSTRAEVERSAEVVTARVSGREAERRARVGREIEAWLGRLLDAGAYRSPLARAPADLLVPYALSLPAPRCTLLEVPEVPDRGVARRCAKMLELDYVVEVEKGTDPRQATIEVALAEDARGVPLEARISGPDLFLRLEETFRVKPIAAEDAAQRRAAHARAAELVSSTFGRLVSTEPACARRASPPAVLSLSCGGLEVVVTASAGPGRDDEIVIKPAR